MLISTSSISYVFYLRLLAIPKVAIVILCETIENAADILHLTRTSTPTQNRRMTDSAKTQGEEPEFTRSTVSPNVWPSTAAGMVTTRMVYSESASCPRYYPHPDNKSPFTGEDLSIPYCTFAQFEAFECATTMTEREWISMQVCGVSLSMTFARPPLLRWVPV